MHVTWIPARRGHIRSCSLSDGCIRILCRCPASLVSTRPHHVKQWVVSRVTPTDFTFHQLTGLHYDEGCCDNVTNASNLSKPSKLLHLSTPRALSLAHCTRVCSPSQHGGNFLLHPLSPGVSHAPFVQVVTSPYCLLTALVGVDSQSYRIRFHSSQLRRKLPPALAQSVSRAQPTIT